MQDFLSEITQILIFLFKAGRNSISYTHYDSEQSRNSKSIIAKAQGILIIEGVGLIRPDLIDYFTYSIWIDCSIDKAIKRGKRRDREAWNNPKDEQWEGVWKKNDLEYYQRFQPQTKVNVVINNN